MSYEIGELQRQLANMIRVGVIAALDEENARVKVKMAGLSTDWLPWGTVRAGTTRTVSMPSEGEQVLVFSPYGDTAQAVVGPSIFQESHPSPSVSKDIEKTIFPDGSFVEYDSASNTLTVTVAANGNVIINCQSATVNAAEKLQVNTPEAEFSGHMTIKNGLAIEGGTVTHDGVNISKTHTHIGSPTAPAGPITPTGAPT